MYQYNSISYRTISPPLCSPLAFCPAVASWEASAVGRRGEGSKRHSILGLGSKEYQNWRLESELNWSFDPDSGHPPLLSAECDSPNWIWGQGTGIHYRCPLTTDLIMRWDLGHSQPDPCHPRTSLLSMRVPGWLAERVITDILASESWELPGVRDFK